LPQPVQDDVNQPGQETVCDDHYDTKVHCDPLILTRMFSLLRLLQGFHSCHLAINMPESLYLEGFLFILDSRLILRGWNTALTGIGNEFSRTDSFT
jgi:hypothetical protein